MSARMFVAVVPPEEVIDDLDEFTDPRRDPDDPLRWVHPENWHVTLAFLPSVDAPHLDRLVENLSEVADRTPAFDVEVSGAGAFPGPAHAKVLWAGVAGDLDGLATLSRRCRNAVSRAGVRVDGGDFHPHLTLARLGRPVDVTRWLRVFDLYRSEQWSATEFVLVESHLGQGRGGGSRYETVAEFTLQPALSAI